MRLSSGLSIFWSELIASFWRGEMIWQNKSLSWLVADRFYAISSLLLVCVAAIGLLRPAGSAKIERPAIVVALVSFLASVAFLVLLSVQFDFGRCVNPSREHPYFTSGRLLGGTLVPFNVENTRVMNGTIDGMGNIGLFANVNARVEKMNISSNGSYGPAALKVQEFVENLKGEVAVPVKTWDERLTSTQANRLLIEGNVRRQKRKQNVDKMAAAILLQSYLDRLTA